jgi:hypothetical protein
MIARPHQKVKMALHRLNFREIPFPGTTTDLEAYLAWRADPSEASLRHEETCEG